jgi:hypothetical protein
MKMKPGARMSKIAFSLCGVAMVLAVASTPAIAQSVQLPNGCTGFVTVQQRSCTVSHHFTCEADPEGFQRRIDMDEEGITFVSTVDREAQWIESIHVLAGYTTTLVSDPVDPASFTRLIETGLDTYDFETATEAGARTRYAGQDALTGEKVEIDGVTLLRTDYRIRATDEAGEELWRSAGQEFVHPEWRLFLAGRSEVTVPDDTFVTDDTPMEFAFPNEDGFLTAKPKYGCTAVLSQLPVLPAFEEINHDHL